MSINLSEELNYLTSLQDILLKEAGRLAEGTTSYSRQFRQSMKYLWENRSGMDAMEIFSTEQSVSQIVRSGEHTAGQLRTIESMLESPYFARIDFLEDGEEEAVKIYIGRFSFRGKRHDYLVYDWRSPIAGMYYDYDTGRAGYSAPAGAITGEISGKRQYKIEHGELKYALESDMSITDEVLQRELSATSDKKMKNIAATIQREQNRLIRNEQSEILIIQGVAGSGKTSVALHRIAYLLYRARETMNAGEVLILSPNKVFADYISNVLPELGEAPLLQLGMTDIAQEFLPDQITYEAATEQAEALPDETEAAYSSRLERTAFKSTLSFLHRLENFLSCADEAYFCACDYRFGDFTIAKDYIHKRFINLKNLPVQNRLAEIAGDLADRLKAMDLISRKAPSKNQVVKQLRQMFLFQDALALYEEFYRHIGRTEMLRLTPARTLEHADLFPFLYVSLWLGGWDLGRPVRHLLIDEMQDYTPVQYAVINKLYPCGKTILGDFGQNINACPAISAADFKALYPNMEYVQLFTSYRSTREIIDFAGTLLPQARIEAAPRHGTPPQILCSDSECGEHQNLLELIKTFQSGSYTTLGIICKSDALALRTGQFLKNHADVHLLNKDSVKFKAGITVTSITMAKGLEFDEVIIPGASAQNYRTAHDRSLLYVAATRAMHALSLTCHGELSPLLLRQQQNAASDITPLPLSHTLPPL